jgi:hypothetical protein
MPTFTLPFVSMLLMPGMMSYLRAMLVVGWLRVMPVDYTEGSLMREVSHVSAAASFPPCHPHAPRNAFMPIERHARGPPRGQPLGMLEVPCPLRRTLRGCGG